MLPQAIRCLPSEELEEPPATRNPSLSETGMAVGLEGQPYGRRVGQCVRVIGIDRMPQLREARPHRRDAPKRRDGASLERADLRRA